MSALLPPRRGHALVLALALVVLATLMVAGALRFTGDERSATALQARNDLLSACTQAARNRFLSRLRVLPANVEHIRLDSREESYGSFSLGTGHFPGTPPEITHVRRLPPSEVGASRELAGDISNSLGSATSGAAWYAITALCQESPSGPQREVEFVIRVGLP
jgi:type II secretory pathway pseudopilin PulG